MRFLNGFLFFFRKRYAGSLGFFTRLGDLIYVASHLAMTSIIV